MNTLETLKQDSLTFRKMASSHDADLRVKTISTLLVTLLSEVESVGKNAGNRPTTDDEATRMIKKFVSNIDETLKSAKGRLDPQTLEKLAIEREALEKYLPQMVSDEEVSAFISAQVEQLAEKSPKQMGAIMKALKEKFGASFDAKTASEKIKLALS